MVLQHQEVLGKSSYWSSNTLIGSIPSAKVQTYWLLQNNFCLQAINLGEKIVHESA